MSDERIPGSDRPRRPGSRFRCPVCARFVQAGDHGLCPNCGYQPPDLLPRRPRSNVKPGPGYWVAAAAISIALALAAAIWAVRL